MSPCSIPQVPRTISTDSASRIVGAMPSPWTWTIVASEARANTTAPRPSNMTQATRAEVLRWGRGAGSSWRNMAVDLGREHADERLDIVGRVFERGKNQADPGDARGARGEHLGRVGRGDAAECEQVAGRGGPATQAGEADRRLFD